LGKFYSDTFKAEILDTTTSRVGFWCWSRIYILSRIKISFIADWNYRNLCKGYEKQHHIKIKQCASLISAYCRW